MRKQTVCIALSLIVMVCAAGLVARAQFKAAAETGQVLQPRATIAPNARTLGAAFVHDGKMVWLTDGNKVQLWDLESGEAKMTIAYHSSDRPDWHMVNISSLALSPDGKTIASADHNGIVKFWDPETAQVKATADLKGGEITSIAWSPDGNAIAAALDRRHIKLLNPATGKVTGTIEPPQYKGFKIVRYSPDGKLLATFDTGNKIYIFDAKTGNLRKTLEIPERVPGRGYQNAEDIAFSPDSKILATGGGHTGYLLDVATGRVRGPLPHEARENQEDQVLGVAFSPDGKLVATACMDGTAKLWNAATGKLKATVKDEYAFEFVTFSPDSRTVLLGKAASTKLYEVPGN